MTDHSDAEPVAPRIVRLTSAPVSVGQTPSAQARRTQPQPISAHARLGITPRMAMVPRARPSTHALYPTGDVLRTVCTWAPIHQCVHATLGTTSTPI